jgi:thioredoxin reductase (NADPH)
VENFPGTLQMSGNEFAEKMLDQILAQGAEIEFENVVSVEDLGDKKVVRTEEGGVYESSTVVLATGVKHRMLGIEGEEELVGEGISFCAVCDGDFYSGRRVCVAGGGNSALQEAILLSEKCSEVIMLQDLDFFTGEQRLQDVLFAKPNVRAFTGVGIKRFLVTDGELCGLEIEEKKTGEKRTVACDGLFVAIGLIPENEPYKALADVNEYGYFDADERCLTKTPGIFVAGDCRSKTVRQLTTAVADGASAALAACRYMQMR